MKRKIFKLLSVIVVLILIVSCFCINASAFTGRKKIPFSASYAIFHTVYGSVIATENCFANVDGSYGIDTARVCPSDYDYYRLTVDGSFDTSSLVGKTVDITFEVADVFSTWLPLESYNGQSSFLHSGDWLSSPNLPLYTADGTRGFSFTLKSVEITSSSTPFFLNLWMQSPDVSDQVFNIYILQNAFVSTVDTSLQDSIDKSSSDIQANADKNANEIKANQDKNANKIINGGRDEPGYNATDKTTTNDYHAKEEEINNQTAEARSSTVSFFNNFGSLLNDTPVSKGLLAVSKIMTHFFSIGWLSGLIQFSLGIGAFAFILGSVIMVVGKVSSRSESRVSKSDNYGSRRRK